MTLKNKNENNILYTENDFKNIAKVIKKKKGIIESLEKNNLKGSFIISDYEIPENLPKDEWYNYKCVNNWGL
jgi:hypothetical protein